MHLIPLVSAAFTALLSALAPAQTPAARPAPGPVVSAEGCLTRQNLAPQPGTDPRGTAVAPAPFVLIGYPPPYAGASAERGSAVRQPPRATYVLTAKGADLNLSAHLNQSVRVTGATTAPLTTAPLSGRSTEATPVTGVTAPPGATGTAFDTANVPSLVVTALTVLSPQCR